MSKTIKKYPSRFPAVPFKYVRKPKAPGEDIDQISVRSRIVYNHYMRAPSRIHSTRTDTNDVFWSGRGWFYFNGGRKRTP